VMVVIGDHQPPALVTGNGASWDVPVHVISDDAALLQRLQARGFVAGLQPPAAPLGAMHALTTLLLQVFDETAAGPASEPATAPAAFAGAIGPGALSALPAPAAVPALAPVPEAPAGVAGPGTLSALGRSAPGS